MPSSDKAFHHIVYSETNHKVEVTAVGNSKTSSKKQNSGTFKQPTKHDTNVAGSTRSDRTIPLQTTSFQSSHKSLVAANNNHVWDQCYAHCLPPLSHQIQSLPLIPSCIKDELGLPSSQKSLCHSLNRIGNPSCISDGTTQCRELDLNSGFNGTSSSLSHSFFSYANSQIAASSQNNMQLYNRYDPWNEKVNGFYHTHISGNITSQNTQAFSLSLHTPQLSTYSNMAQPLQFSNSYCVQDDSKCLDGNHQGHIETHSNESQQLESFFNKQPTPSHVNQTIHVQSQEPLSSLSWLSRNDSTVDSLSKSLQTSLTVSTVPLQAVNDIEVTYPPNMTNNCSISFSSKQGFAHTRASSSDQVDLITEGNWHEPYEKAIQNPSINVHPNGYSSVPNSPSKHRRMGSNSTIQNPASLNLNLNLVHNTTDIGAEGNNGPTSPSKKESSDDKVALKEFQNLLKNYEPLGYERAKSLTMNYLNDPKCSLERHMHWRVHMELADLAKRENLLEQARLEFCTVNKMQPNASQGWLEYAKLEEESGNNEKCGRLLLEGLDKCKHNESLLIKAIKHFEQNDDLQTSRSILGRLKGQKPETCWKILLEGALLESRAGNVNVARKVFKYLMKNVHRHGPIYYEAYKLEEKCEQFDQALNIVEQGLIANPRYGPLWFAALRLYERKLDRAVDMESKEQCLTEVRQCISRAAKSISKELKWKVYFELAQFEERASHLQLSRKAYSKSAIKALENLRWKVWLAGSRTELNAGNIEISRMLLNRALQEVPSKTKAVVLIECARLEEFCNHLDKARDFLNRAKQEAKHEWKVFLESILLEMRAGNIEQATCEALEALQIHRGTGRLWAILIQLHHMKGNIVECCRVFKEALEEVPKSGEVWCEGARIALNPLSPKFSLEKAKRCLDFAIKFTPQYGDSFIEYLRLELLTRGPSIPNSAAAPVSTTNSNEAQEHIENMCVNADPNYGPLWFHCKSHPLDSTRQVLRRAKEMLMSELAQQKETYQHAIMTRHSKKTKFLEGDKSREIRTFITGLCSLNQMYNNHNLSFEMRKKYIYLNEISV